MILILTIADIQHIAIVVKLASSFALCCISVNTDTLEEPTDNERSETDTFADVREQPLKCSWRLL